jgi:alpha-amylase
MNTSGVYAFSPYGTPYEAFTNYMNVLSDFIVRVEEQYPLSIENEELNALITTIRNQATEIGDLKREVELMRNNIINDIETKRAAAAAAAAAEKPAKTEKAPKAPAKKATEKPAKKVAAEKPAKKAAAEKPAKKATTKKSK